MKREFIAGLCLGLLGLSSHAAQAPATFISGLLVERSGFTLYTFDIDTPNVSQCNTGCVNTWPPLTASRDDIAQGMFTIVVRRDGTLQWAYRGQPLYRFVADNRQGQVKGDGVSGIWHAVRMANANDLVKE